MSKSNIYSMVLLVIVNSLVWISIAFFTGAGIGAVLGNGIIPAFLLIFLSIFAGAIIGVPLCYFNDKIINKFKYKNEKKYNRQENRKVL